MKVTFSDVVAVSSSVIGSFLIASNFSEPKWAFIGYIAFAISSVVQIMMIRNSNAAKSLVFIQLYFLVMNLYGIFTRIN